MRKQSFKSFIENKLLSDVYNIMKKDRDNSTGVKVAWVAETSKANNAASRLVPKPNGNDDCYGSRMYVAKA